MQTFFNICKDAYIDDEYGYTYLMLIWFNGTSAHMGHFSA